MRLLIRGGDVLDGTGAPSTSSDVLISDGRIEEIAPNISAPDALAIDAVGCVVTPGFVDMHRHCDIAAVTGGAFGKLELAQGITSTIAGNCGLAPVPCAPSHRRELYDFLEPITGAIAPDLLFQDYSSYLNALKAASLPLNVGFLAGLGAIRTAILGFTKNPLSADGLKTAEAFVRQAMEHGAFGISTGLMYQPECYALCDEMVAQAKIAAKYDGILCAHIRGEGDHLVESVREAIGIAMKSGIRLNISHFKGTGVRNWGKAVYLAMEEIEAARARGHEVTADFYPYDGGATTLLSLIPPSVTQSDNAATLRYLETNAGRDALRRELRREHPGWDNMALSIGWSRIVISSAALPEDQHLMGKDIQTLSGDRDPADFVCDLLLRERGKVGIIVLSMDQRDVDAIARLPYTAVISDALYGGGRPHPRLYGAFPKIIEDYVLRRAVLTLPEAIHKMTGMPAERLRLKDRGLLRSGYRADINIFNPSAIRAPATFEEPEQIASGMTAVLIAGQKPGRSLGRAMLK